MSNIIMIHKAGPFGDCTDLYDLRLASRTTVKEFIDEVLALEKMDEPSIF